MRNSQGQIVVILLLIIIVALAVALSTITKSVNEISTATQTEESSRAFSAAEAGIERAVRQYSIPGDVTGSGSVSIDSNDLDNRASANVNVGSEPQAGAALEYPPFGKDSLAQFWFVKPTLDISTNLNCSATNCYEQGNFDIYFGDRSQEYTSSDTAKANAPALEVVVVSLDTVNNKFYSNRYFVDTYSGTDSTRNSNGFGNCTESNPVAVINSYFGPDRQIKFSCRYRVSGYKNGVSANQPILARVKVLYTNTAHPVAVQPLGGDSLPPQASYYKSTGSAGETQRTLLVFTEKSFMPFWLDYVLFSRGGLQKDYR